jgi:hypothetical protein
LFLSKAGAHCEATRRAVQRKVIETFPTTTYTIVSFEYQLFLGNLNNATAGTNNATHRRDSTLAFHFIDESS